MRGKRGIVLDSWFVLLRIGHVDQFVHLQLEKNERVRSKKRRKVFVSSFGLGIQIQIQEGAKKAKWEISCSEQLDVLSGGLEASAGDLYPLWGSKNS